MLDFYQAAEYIAQAAWAAYPRDTAQRELWTEAHCHALKHKRGATARLLQELEALRSPQWSRTIRQDLERAITYFRNHQHQMHYARYRAQGLPIGSGVTEAACQTLVKQRLCCSGRKWVERGARIVLSLRALVLTNERWQQFWAKINQYGFALPASIYDINSRSHLSELLQLGF